MNLSNIACLNIKGSNCCCIITGISKNEAINLMQNIDLIEKRGIRIIKHKNSLSHIKMVKEILTFGDTEISGEKNYKYFIGYLYNDHKVKPLHLVLPKTSAYVKRCDGQTKWMYFLIEDDDLLEKYII